MDLSERLEPRALSRSECEGYEYLRLYTPAEMEKGLRELFRQIREQRTLTQPQVAAAGGVSQGLISRIEKDPNYQPSVSVFLRAIQGLGIPVAAFFLQMEGSQSSSLTVSGAQSHSGLAPVDVVARGSQIPIDEAAVSDAELQDLGRALVRAARAATALHRPASSDRPTRPRRRAANRRPR